MGKTGFASCVALNLARDGRRVLIFSLEAPTLELTERLLSSWTAIDLAKIKRQDAILDEERQYLLQKAGSLEQLKIDIDDDAGATVSRIAAKCRVWKRKHGLDLVIVDYLQLIEPEDAKIIREQQVAVISRTLKKLAMQLEVPVMCLCQLNRQVESRPNKVPTLADLRESGSIEQDANLVILVHRPEFYNPDDRPGEVDLILAKNRSGRIGKVSLQFDKPTISFRERAMAHYQEW